MRHNKIVGWDAFLGVVEQIEKLSPWLSRQIAKRAAEWPFWYSGLQIREWANSQVKVQMAMTFRNSMDSEICQGHALLGAELTLRLSLLRYRQEFPFRYRLIASRVESLQRWDQTLEFRFGLGFDEWEALRLELAGKGRAESEFVVQAYLADGRMAAVFTFQAAFELEKFLTA
jgi:hypothetical protein